MNLIAVIIIGVLMWLLFSLLKSYRELQKELRYIRVKCVTPGGGVPVRADLVAETAPNPYDNVKGTLIGALKMIGSSI